MADLTGATTELLQQLIRNACVNDGTLTSGNENRSVDTIVSYLEGPGVDLQRYEPQPGRGSVIARIEGSDRSAPSLCLMGHLDVVPVNPDGWERDPFGGELVDGVVWGRGAVDMLNLTSSMAVAFRELVRSGFRPRGTLMYLGVADEEALGTWGAKWLTENEADDVRVDYVITEFGGMRFPIEAAGGPKLALMAGEKGTYWCTIRVRGTPGHASMPFRTDNAIVKAAEVVRRLNDYRPETQIHEIWRGFVDAMEFDEALREQLLDPEKLWELLESVPPGLSRMLHACTHTTFAPTILHGGVKTNIIPDTVELQVDVRTLPGQTGDQVREQLREALGDLFDDVEIVADSDFPASASPMDTPLADVLNKVSASLVPGASTVPFLVVGATDSRYFRKLGITSYGYGLFSERIPFDQFASMFHGDNERIDQESLRLETELWLAVAHEFLG